MFFRRANKVTLVETCEEVIKVEKNYLPYEPKKTGKVDTFPRKKIERPNRDKDKAFDFEQLQNATRVLTNEVVGLKNNSESSSSRGYFRNQFRQNTNSNSSNPFAGAVVNEDKFNTIHVVLSIPKSSSNQAVFYQEE